MSEKLSKNMTEEEYKAKSRLVERYLKALYPRDKQKVEKLRESMMEKYGVYASDLLKSAMCSPKYLNQDLGHAFQSSVKTVEYLLSDDVDMAKVAKALKINEEDLARSDNVVVSEPVVKDEKAERAETKDVIKEQEVKKEQDVKKVQEDKKEPEAKEKGAERAETKEVVKQQRYEADKIISSKKGLMEACWDVFGERRGKGSVLRMHVDEDGAPTIGAGHLVMSNPPTAGQRDGYIRKMVKIGVPRAQAEKEFDAVAAALTTKDKNKKLKTQVINGAEVIVYPKLKPITEEQAKKLFDLDTERHYQDAIRCFPDLHKYPIELQTLIIHHGYSCGSVDDLKKRCGKDISPENIARQAGKMRAVRCSTNTACEVRDAYVALNMENELPKEIQAKVRNNPHHTYDRLAGARRNKNYNIR